MLPSETVFNQSIWGDEGFSAILSMHSLPEIIKIIINDTSPPLWNISEWIVFNTLGTDEIYIRGLAFLFYLLTIFFVFLIGKLIWDKRTGVITAALAALNPFFFIYAFEGRMYSIMALGVTASMYFFLRIRMNKGDPRLNSIGYVIATLWALYSHHFAMFALILQGLWFVYELVLGKRDVAKKYFLLFIAVGIGYLPWVYPLYNQTRMVGGGFWLGTPDLKDLGNLTYEYLAGGIKHQLNGISLCIVLAILVLRKWKKDLKSSIFLVSWFLFPILATWLVSQFFQSIFYNRYLLYAIPATMILLGSNRRKASGILIAILLIMFVVVDYNYFVNPVKLPFRQMGAWVSETRQEGDFLINWNAGSHHLWETKYYGFGSPIYVGDGGELPYFVGTALMKETDIVREIPEGTTRVGVTTSGAIEDIDLPGYTQNEVKEIDGLKFVWLTYKAITK